MDKVGQVTMMANTEVIKEPRGFIKFIQIILAIFAFATTTAYNGSTEGEITCINKTVPVKPTFGYSFRLNGWPGVECNDTKVTMYGDYGPPSEFFVAVGVLCFLYSLAAVILYVFADDKYRQIEMLPAVDLVMTVVFVLFWLIASSAWADGVNKVKHYTYPENLQVGDNIAQIGTVKVISGGSYASLNVSIIFGFLNMCVWVGNIWFLYKETKWFRNSSNDGNQGDPTGGMPENPQQRI